jgi:predicted metal-dependent peptidase
MINDVKIWDGHTGVSPHSKILYIGPDIKHFNDSIKLLDILLDHETLHLVLDEMGEKITSDKLDTGMPSIVIEDLRVGLEGLVKT